MIKQSTRPKNFFRKLVVNGVSSSKAAIQNHCLMRLYDADSELKAISSELDSFDGKKDQVRCNLLVNQLRTAQDKVISLLFQLMDDCNCERASRDYRMKFPDEILLSEGSESLNGQIWFGAECLSAGSNILNHNKESTMLRPMAKTLTQHLDSLRNDLRDLVIDRCGAARINDALIKKMVAFDHIFATFEYEYVRTMLPIRTVAEIEKLQEVAVLFSETLIDSLKRGLIKQEDIDEFQPIVMIAIPRLAIVRGLLYKNENPIYTRHKSQMCSLFQPFHGPLHSIRKLLRGLRPGDLFTLERILANDRSIYGENEHQDNHSEESTTKNVVSIEDYSPNDSNNPPQHSQDESADQAGTSNGHHANVLMDGLQCPGEKEVEIDDLLRKQAQQLLHRLFVAISGVADQLQSNFASDLRFILRHIFSSEIAGEDCDADVETDVQADSDNALDEVSVDDEDDEGDYSNDQCDSSLPIEQGIEARETNLIDFESGYTLTDPVDRNELFSDNTRGQDQNSPFDNPATLEQHYLSAHQQSIDTNSPMASVAVNSQHNSNIQYNQTDETQRILQNALGQGQMNHDLLANLMRATDHHPQQIHIYNSPAQESPNDPSVLESGQHHQRLMQHHLQSVSRATNRIAAAAAAASTAAMPSYRHGATDSNPNDSGYSHHVSSGQRSMMNGSERPHIHHGSSRSRRVRGPPVWVPDQDVIQCNRCASSFTLFKRRHHCRACGQIFCADCSKYTKTLNCWGYNGPVRVCESCYNQP